MYSGFDPNSIDTDAALQAADETAQYIEDEENEEADNLYIAELNVEATNYNQF